MPLDPSIPLQARGIDLPSPVDSYAKALTLRSLVNQGALQDLQIGEAQRAATEKQTLRDVLRNSGGDLKAAVPALMNAGLYDPALKLQKAAQEQEKNALDIKNVQSQITERNWKTEKAKTDTFIQAASGPLMKYKELVSGGMPDAVARQTVQPLYEQSIVGAFQTGLFDKAHMQGIPAQFDPQWAESALNRTMTYDKVLTDWRAQRTFQETQRHNTAAEAGQEASRTETRRHNVTTEGLTVRGQNMTDTRAREQMAAGRAPTGYRFKTDGTLEPIPGGPAAGDRALSETQGKATAFAMRMQDANKIISQLEGSKNFDPAAVTTQFAGSTGFSAPLNYMASPEAQNYEQAKRNWVTANLRLESGAAIPDSELQNEYRKWFPIPGDSAQVIAQKAAARRVAEQAMAVQAGPGAKRIGGGIKFLGFE